MKQYDVTKAFIRADMDDDVYMRLPKGCDILTGKVVLLNKVVCGLKQAGRQWNLKLVQTFTDEMGSEQSKSDPCLFRLMRSDRFVLISAVHVDDIIVAAEAGYQYDWFYAELRRMFPSRHGTTDPYQITELCPFLLA